MMRAGLVLRVLGKALRAFAPFFAIPAAVALAYDPWDAQVGALRFPSSAFVFAACGLVTAAASWPATWIGRRLDEGEGSEREGYVGAALLWLIAPVFGGMPFWAANLLSPLESYTEAMAGLTATAMTALDGASDSFRLWRSLLSWLGGAAFLVFTATTLSMLASPLRPAPGTQAPKTLRPRLADTARWVMGTYTAATAVGLLAIGVAVRQAGIPWSRTVLEAPALTFASISTGGVGMRGTELASYASGWVVAAVAAVSILGATGLYVLVALRKGAWGQAARDPEWRFLVSAIAVASVLLAAFLAAGATPWGQSLREAGFAATSLATGTGFHATSWDAWPVGAHIVLLALLFLGGCATSTSGGLKAWRVLLMVRLVRRETQRVVHPRAVLPVRVGRQTVPEAAILGTVAFLVTYLFAWLLGALALSLTEPGIGVLEATGGSAAALGNVGAAFGAFGPTADVAALSAGTHVVLGVLMWLGRLEILAAILVLMPATWRR